MRLLATLLLALLLVGGTSACGSGSGSSGPTTRNVVLTWNANREAGVNKAGGGYRVSIVGQPDVNVPWVSGPAAPTTTTLALASGTYTVSIKAYAALDASGGTTGSTSAASQTITVVVP